VLEEDRMAKEVVDVAIKLHKQFGPGVYESVYEPLMIYELEKRGFEVRSQISAPLMYDGIKFEVGFTMDVVVCELVILELKSVEKLVPAHFKQVLTYLRLTGLRLGLLIIFGEAVLKNGIHRIVNNL
jgi:GxxExxY protein